MSVIAERPVYTSELGAAYCGDSVKLLAELPDESINLVMTSPPFALQREKEYLDRSGNRTQEDYVEWLARFGELVFQEAPAGRVVRH